jgi:hypothetical protein
MTIDKMFSAIEEISDLANAQTEALTVGVSSADGPVRTSSLADVKSVFPEPRIALRNRDWQIRCEDCDPERGGYYWFSLGQCDTPAKALDCIMQLNEKRSSPIVMQSFIDLVECLFGRGAITEE